MNMADGGSKIRLASMAETIKAIVINEVSWKGQSLSQQFDKTGPVFTDAEI